MYSVVGWNILLMSVRTSWFMVVCCSNISLLMLACWIYNLLKDMLNSPLIIVDFSISLYSSVNFSSNILLFCNLQLEAYIFLENWPLLSLCNTSIYLLIFLLLWNMFINVALLTFFLLVLPWYTSNPLLLTYHCHYSFSGDLLDNILRGFVSLSTLSISTY